MVEVVAPSATTDVGLALTVEVPAVTGPTVNVTVAVWVMGIVSVECVGEWRAPTTTVSFTVNEYWPLALVVPLTVVMVELPPLAASETTLPLTGWLEASFRVTVMAEVVLPSATTDVGLALTVDVLALTAPSVKVTVAVWVMVIESVE